MRIFKKIFNRLRYIRAIRSSSNFINYLRNIGMTIGEDCFFQSPKTATIDPTRPVLIDIGNHCYFLENFTLLTHDNITKVFGPIYHEFIPSSGKVKIGNNVFFARNCTVLKGVTIGDNTIVGYGSVVTKSTPPNSVIAGVPAKVICSIEDYYLKRRRESLDEAFALVKEIYKKTGKRPTVQQMSEEFPFWMEGEQEDERLRFSVKYQTRGFNDLWKEEHKAEFDSFDQFIDAALNS